MTIGIPLPIWRWITQNRCYHTKSPSRKSPLLIMCGIWNRHPPLDIWDIRIQFDLNVYRHCLDLLWKYDLEIFSVKVTVKLRSFKLTSPYLKNYWVKSFNIWCIDTSKHAYFDTRIKLGANMEMTSHDCTENCSFNIANSYLKA